MFTRPPFRIGLLAMMMLAGLTMLLAGCVSHPSATFRNPTFRCPSSDIVEPDSGDYPYPVKGYPSPSEKKSVAEIKAFCNKMREHFAASNMSFEEAKQFRTLLEITNGNLLPSGYHLYLDNEDYGMPGGDMPEPFDFEKQVMLKSVSESEYEIFYFHIGCGRNYTHEKVHLESGTIIQVTLLERWSESYPC